jgi:hypothetical protein
MPLDLVGIRQRFARAAAGRPPIIRVSFATGVAANTNIAVSGIKLNDKLIAVLLLSGTQAASSLSITSDEIATTSITSAGNIQDTLATNSNAFNQVLVVWLQVTAP